MALSLSQTVVSGTAPPHASTLANRTARAEMSPAACLSLIALVLLGTRFVQGFIFWGGASRRLFYDFEAIAGVDHAVKLDFEAAGFVAAKLVHALPGVLFLQAPIEWMLSRPALIDASVWLWTFAELAVGLGLVFGLLTRFAALGALAINLVLMLVFGWMGSTCLDEWTMAVSGVAMSSAIFLAGGGAWSLDATLGRGPSSTHNGWSCWLFSGTMSVGRSRGLAITLAAFAVIFTVSSYQMLFGAVVSPLHARVNFHNHGIALANVTTAVDGAVQFDAYVDAGPDTGAAYIVAARLVDTSGAVVASWDGATLAELPVEAIANQYPYAWASKFKTETIGFSGETGARATIDLPAPDVSAIVVGGDYRLVLEAINGAIWEADVAPGGA